MSEPQIKAYIKKLKEEYKNLQEKNMMLELDLGEVNEVIGESMKAISENQKLKQENAELKAMLKLAIDDIKPLMENYTWLSECKMCAKDIKSCNGCCEPTWRYAEQALKLIGGETNEN